MRLLEDIRSGVAQVGVLGLGYVGLTEAVDLARAGFRVTGFDVNERRLADVNAGHSYLTDVSDAELERVVGAGALRATGDMDQLAGMDVIMICVPTPLSKSKAPDLSYILSAVDSIRQRLRPGQLIILESTTYPGTTTEVVLPALASTGYAVGHDYYLCFSPERINPGDRKHPSNKIPRILGGITPACTEAAAALYAAVAPEVLVVSSTQTAEMVKLLENTFRAVNIGLVNELALMCRSFGIDVWEVVDAAASKPFGFMPFYPGPGLGGHCIPIDPLHLSWKARSNGFEPRFIDLAHQVNSAMPRFVVSMVAEALNREARSVKGARILILGVSYKANVNDARESPATVVIAELAAQGAEVVYHDPHVPVLEVDGRQLRSIAFTDETVRSADCVVILTDHSVIDYERVVELATRVIDTRNATRGLRPPPARVVKL
jgi:UDP-N-acetyl-D-glucosamine dehydrogenase